MRAAHGSLYREPHLLPESWAGRRAVALFTIAAGSFAFLVVVVAGLHRSGELFSNSWLLAVPALLGGSAAAAAAVVGVYAILRRHEDGVLVYVGTATGLLVISFALGEALAHH